MNTEEFIKRSKEKHGYKYDYSLVEYINNHTYVKIICPEHGIFEQEPRIHLNCGCKKCTYSTKNDFIKKSNMIHNNKYDYSLVEYKGVLMSIKIICPEHGIFEQMPSHHKNGRGCPYCRGYVGKDGFINKANEIHKNKYDYSLVEYKNQGTKVKILCPEHGIFEQLPSLHINKKNGCPVCTNNKKLTLESFIEKSIEKHGKKFDYSLVELINSKTKVKIICPTHGIFIQMAGSHLRYGCKKCADNYKIGENEDYKRYILDIRNYTKKNKNKLFENWDGFDYYDGEYIKENISLNCCESNYPTIDHKISIFYGYKNNISPEIIGDISNLCITKRFINSSKNSKTEDEYKSF
ncbi:hypothetical protein M0Q50_09035 [bacterium]|jgi:hypothetical protein|nr:hypothetical protein [bacterium]